MVGIKRQPPPLEHGHTKGFKNSGNILKVVYVGWTSHMGYNKCTNYT